MACTLIQTTLFVVYLASFWPLSPVSAAKPAATAAQSTMIYHCSVCKCSITVLQRGQSIAADCSNLQLTETPLDLPRRIGTLNMSKNKVNSSQLLHLYKYPNLRHLKASFNAFTTFNVSKEGALSSNFQILTLDLSGNVLKYVNNHTFNKMPYIREIRGLEALTFSSNSLNQLTDLQKLSITSHQVDIPEDLFRNLRISDLKLNATEALYLPEKLFRYSQRPLLSNLLIVGRELRELHVNIMRNLVLLNRVEIVGTNMRLPAHLFHEDTDGPNNNENMPVNLKTIIIDGVRSLPRIIFHKQKSLEHLELHGVEDLPFGLFESVTLDSLDLSGCDIYELQSESFQGLSSLRMLNLSDTKLTSIKVSAFTGLQSLTSLDLSNNFIDNIAPALFDKLRRTLVTLVISNSSLDVLDESAFRNMMSLEKLDLSKNNLTSLPPSLLSDLGKLVDLNLKENQLHNIPPNVLQAQVNMEDLNLGTNLLTGLPPKVFDTTRSLRKVDLSGNNITFLPENIFKGTHFLETVKLSGNPLHCGCEVLLLPQNIIGLELHGYCTSPIEYASTPIQDVQTGDRCIPTTTTTTPTTTTTSTTTTTPTTTTIPITTTTPTTTTTTLARGIMISPITVKDESSTESTQYVDRFGSTRWTVSSYGDIQPSVTLTNANTTTTYNDSYRANVELAQSGGHIFGSFGLDGIYIAMGVVATVFSLGSFAMVMYRRRQAARSMVYVVNPEESTDHSGDGLVGNFARVEPESFDRVVVDDNSPGENPGVRPGP